MTQEERDAIRKQCADIMLTIDYVMFDNLTSEEHEAMCGLIKKTPALLDALDAEKKRADEANRLKDTYENLRARENEKYKSDMNEYRNKCTEWREKAIEEEADRDRWKARAEALERAIYHICEVEYLHGTKCGICTRVQKCRDAVTKEDNDNLKLEFGDGKCWQFDEARFAVDELD